MADEQFDLGEVVGGYEQAKADRDFYLNMINMGRENKGAFMASPIAAYLYGVSNVKMANMRAKAQNIEDQRQAEKDAIAATQRAQQRQANLDNQIVSLVKGARDGSIPASVAATMMGPLLKEKGINVKQFIPEKSLIIGNEPGDTEDFEWDLSEKENSLEPGRNKRAADRIAWEREKQERGIQGQKEVAAYKAGLKEQGQSKGGASVSNRWQSFKTAYGPVIEAINGKNLDELEDMPDRVIEGFIADYDPAFGIDDILKIVKQEKERRSGIEEPEPIAEKKSNNVIGFLFGNK